MPCYHPIDAWRQGGYEGNEVVQRLVFTAPNGAGQPELQVPCGQCIGCRLERSRQWAIRCMHEASLHADNCFLTLTYDNEFLPTNASLDKTAFPRFMKRLRKHYTGKRIRYFHCGEYGAQLQRPHYHACLFGHDFDDKEPWSQRGEHTIWRSATLEKLWPFGLSELGTVTFESAAYVARYITKKVTGSAATDHYNVVDYTTGEILSSKEPEYTTMSRKPGLGYGWMVRYYGDTYPSDTLVVRGNISSPPRYYDDQYNKVDPVDLESIKAKRTAKIRPKDNTPERLAVRETVTLARLNLTKRSMES